MSTPFVAASTPARTLQRQPSARRASRTSPPQFKAPSTASGHLSSPGERPNSSINPARKYEYPGPSLPEHPVLQPGVPADDLEGLLPVMRRVASGQREQMGSLPVRLEAGQMPHPQQERHAGNDQDANDRDVSLRRAGDRQSQS